MSRDRIIPLLPFLLAGAMCASPLDSLRKNPPFGAARAAAPPGASGQPIEFRGVAEENGVLWFSIHDPATGRTLWRRLNDADDRLVVRQYDASTNTLTVDYQSRPLSLTLRAAPRVAGPAVVPMGVPGQQPPVLAQVQPAAVASGDNAQRLQQIAEEIRRRRALRQQTAAQPGNNPSQR